MPTEGEVALHSVPVMYALHDLNQATYNLIPRDSRKCLISKDVGTISELNNNYYVEVPPEGDSPRRDALVTINTGLSLLVRKMSLKRKSLMLDVEGM